MVCSISGPGPLIIDSNVTVTCRLPQAARAHWVQLSHKHFPEYHISTHEVAASLMPTRCFQEPPPMFPTLYFASKVASDDLVSTRRHTYGQPIALINFYSNYEPWQFLEPGQPPQPLAGGGEPGQCLAQLL